MMSQLKWVPSLFCFSFLIHFFLKLIVACRLCVIYMREDDDSNVFSAANLALAGFPLTNGWGGCEVSCCGHHRPRGKTTTGSALDGAVFDIAQILAYLVHNMSRSQLR